MAQPVSHRGEFSLPLPRIDRDSDSDSDRDRDRNQNQKQNRNKHNTTAPTFQIPLSPTAWPSHSFFIPASWTPLRARACWSMLGSWEGGREAPFFMFPTCLSVYLSIHPSAESCGIFHECAGVRVSNFRALLMLYESRLCRCHVGRG